MNEEEEPRSSGEQLVFASLQEECNYFRAQYESTVQKVEEIQAESQTLDDLIETLNGLNQSLEESNDALEQKQKEDEEDIQALEKRLRQLEDQLQDAKEELEVVKQKRTEEAREYNASVSNMQRKIENLEKEVDDRKQAIVKLELGNDDLERSQRNALSSILDLESKHNRLLEEKILLEEDLLGRERLEEELQRLRDELRDQTLETAYLKSQLEKKQEEIDKLKPETTKTQHETSTPAIHRISKSTSSASLSTPPTAVAAQRHMFMSPVAERFMEIDESPNSSSILTNSTIRANGAGVVVPVGSPSQIPVARLKRLSEVGAASSPGSPSLRRSNTVDSLSRNNNSPQQTRSSPLSPRYGAAAGNLNRSTNSRNIASLALVSSSATGSPAPPARYAAVQRHASSSTSTSTPLRPLATPRKHSDSGTNSIYAAKRQEISSKTANLVARLQGISAAHKTVVRKTSGGFHRVANAISHHTHTGHGMLARSVSGQSDHADHQQQHGKGQEQGQQTGHDLPGVVLGDISTVSTNSPGSWVVVKDRSTMTTNGNSGGFIPLDQENKNVAAVSVNRADDPGAFLSVSVNRSLRSLPTRPGIPSPLNQSVGSKPISTQERNAVVTARRNTRVHQATSNMTVASSSTSESNRSLASLSDGGMRVFSRPDSRLSGRDAESDDWVRSSEAGGDDHLPMIAPPPPSSRHHRIDGVRPAGHRRVIEPPPPSTSRSNNVIEQSALPPRSSSVQGHHRAHASRPISSRRKTPPPGVAAAGSTNGTPGGSAIPRRSVSGRRPMSMSMVPQDIVPPLPVGALAHVEAGRRAAAIGMGLPSSSRRMGGV